MNSMMQDIEEAYGSYEKPNWSFAQKRLQRGWQEKRQKSRKKK